MKWANLWKDFGVYLFCLTGTLTTKVIPDLQAEHVEIILPTWQSLIASGVIAIIAVAIGEKTGDIAGRRANFKRRAMSAFLLGVFWIEVMEKFI